MITAQVFWLTFGLSIGWGWYLAACIHEYERLHKAPVRLRAETIRGFRRVIVAGCLFSFHASVVLRTGLILLGFNDAFIGAVLTFALIGIDVTGCIFCLTSLWYD